MFAGVSAHLPRQAACDLYPSPERDNFMTGLCSCFVWFDGHLKDTPNWSLCGQNTYTPSNVSYYSEMEVLHWVFEPIVTDSESCKLTLSTTLTSWPWDIRLDSYRNTGKCHCGNAFFTTGSSGQDHPTTPCTKKKQKHIKIILAFQKLILIVTLNSRCASQVLESMMYDEKCINSWCHGVVLCIFRNVQPLWVTKM